MHFDYLTLTKWLLCTPPTLLINAFVDSTIYILYYRDLLHILSSLVSHPGQSIPVLLLFLGA